MIEEWFRLEDSEGDLAAGIRNALRIVVVFWIVAAYVGVLVWAIVYFGLPF